MFIIRSKQDAERFVSEIDNILPRGEGYHLSMPIEYNDSAERVSQVRKMLYYSPGTDTYRIEEFLEVEKSLASESWIVYKPAMIELVWIHRKTINQELRELAAQRKGGVA